MLSYRNLAQKSTQRLNIQNKPEFNRYNKN
jgi:hypothetical protein